MKKRIGSIASGAGLAGWILLAFLLSDTVTNGVYLLPGQSRTESSLIQSSEALILNNVNRERTKHGLPELTWAPDIAEVALRHSEDMATKGYFSHVNQEGDSVDTRLEKAGIVFSVSAENLFTTNDFTEIAESSVRSWMNSPPHRDNLLNADVTDTGIGIHKAVRMNTYYITQVFIKRALKIYPSPARLSDKEIDTIFDIISAAINKSKYDYSDSAVKKRILKELTDIGITVKEDVFVEGFLGDIPVLGIKIDILAGSGFIVDFTEDGSEDDLGLYSRLVHRQGYSAAVLISETDGKILFPIIKIQQTGPE